MAAVIEAAKRLLAEGFNSQAFGARALGPEGPAGKVAAEVDRPLGTDQWDVGEVVQKIKEPILWRTRLT